MDQGRKAYTQEDQDLIVDMSMIMTLKARWLPLVQSWCREQPGKPRLPPLPSFLGRVSGLVSAGNGLL